MPDSTPAQTTLLPPSPETPFQKQFFSALSDERQKYASWYADRLLETDDAQVRIYAPGEYEDGELTARGQQIWEDEFEDKAQFFDHAARRFLTAYEVAKFDQAEYPSEMAAEVISDLDPEMDLGGIFIEMMDAMEALDALNHIFQDEPPLAVAAE